MDYEIITLEEKTVAGISARTNNTDPNMGLVIGGLWNRFFDEGIYAEISGKVNEKALGIYTDYAGSEKDDYTVMTACEVSKEPAEKQLTVRKIPAGRYARFIAKGDMKKAVAECWQKIWQMDLPRTFVCDFEEYQNDDMEHSEIHIYIGLKDEGAVVSD